MMHTPASPSTPASMSEVHLHDQLPSIEDIRSQVVTPRKKGKCRVRLWAGILLVLAIILASVFLGIAVKKGRSGSSDWTLTLAQAERYTEVVEFLEDHSDHDQLHAEGSAQFRAARWMAVSDPKQLSISGHRFLQRYALMVLYYATSGENWLYDIQFANKMRDECHWNHKAQLSGRTVDLGVTSCNSNGEVTAIALEGCALVGQLPEELSLLTKLKSLTLDYNSLSGFIPDSMHTMTQMTTLTLTYNDFASKVPHWLGNLKNLEVLGLSNNEFHSTLPTELERMTSLRVLGLNNNVMTGSLAVIATMKSLEQVYLQQNSLTGSLDNAFLADLTALEKLDISGNRLEGVVPRGLFHHASLQTLDLHNNQLTGKLPEDFPTSSTLQVLRLQENKLSGSIPLSISKLESIENLNLSDNKFHGVIPATVGSMTNMTCLVLSGNPFGKQAVPPLLKTLTKLHHLSLKDTQRTGKIPTWIGDLTGLVLLDLDSNHLTGSVPSQISKMNGLELLLLNNNKLTGELPSELWGLTHLGTVLIENTTLTGSAGGFCNLDIVTFAADCDKFECPCCSVCCPGTQCNEEYLTNLGTFRHENDYETMSQPSFE